MPKFLYRMNRQPMAKVMNRKMMTNNENSFHYRAKNRINMIPPIEISLLVMKNEPSKFCSGVRSVE